jgi:hypothetical protein
MKIIGQKALRFWNAAFLSPEPALNLAVARILFAGHALWVLLSRDLPAYSALPAEFWTFVYQAELNRFLIVPGHPALEYALQAIAVLALAAAVFGILPRTACFVAALLLYHLAPLETIYWTPNPYQRGFTIDVLALFTLSFSRCGDALTVRGRRAAPDPSPDYCWPLRLVQFHLAIAYLISGAAKLIRVGPQWMDPANLRDWFLLFAQQDQVRRLGSLHETVGPWIADHWLLCLLAGMFGVAANLAFIATPFSRYARYVLVPDAVFFHLMVFLSMSIFWINLPQLLVFVNWHWLAAQAGARRAAVRTQPCAD